MAEKKASPDDLIHEPLAGEAAEGTVDLQLEMNGVILATFTAAVVQYDRWHEFSDDIDVRMRGREQLSEIVEMKKALGPVYDKACREVWNAQLDRGVGEIEREEHYWGWGEQRYQKFHRLSANIFYNELRRMWSSQLSMDMRQTPQLPIV